MSKCIITPGDEMMKIIKKVFRNIIEDGSGDVFTANTTLEMIMKVLAGDEK